MASNILTVLRNAWQLPDLRKRIIFTAGLLVAFRLFAHIPVPGVDTAAIKNLFASNQFLGLLDIFSGGTLVNFSVMAMGIYPYITASIIMQLVAKVFPMLEELQKEGEYGRQKINQYTRLITVPLTILQAIGMLAFLRSQHIITGDLAPISLTALILTMTAGTILVMWFGELITEHGIGNGISLMVFFGIVGRLPISMGQTATSFSGDQMITTLIFLVMAGAVIAGIVFVDQAQRQITVHYASRIMGGRMMMGRPSILPLKVNQAGVIPIIFAASLILIPSMVSQYLSAAPQAEIANIAQAVGRIFSPDGWVYNVFYLVLVIGFSYFTTAMYFDTQKISEMMQKQGGFIPGIRPGTATQNYLNYIVGRITLAGALFLGAVAILPSIARQATGITTMMVGGTGVLIVVSVVLETTKAVEAMLVMRNYDKFSKK